MSTHLIYWPFAITIVAHSSWICNQLSKTSHRACWCYLQPESSTALEEYFSQLQLQGGSWIDKTDAWVLFDFCFAFVFFKLDVSGIILCRMLWLLNLAFCMCSAVTDLTRQIGFLPWRDWCSVENFFVNVIVKLRASNLSLIYSVGWSAILLFRSSLSFLTVILQKLISFTQWIIQNRF